MPRARQARQYQAMQEEIKATARRLMAAQGAEGLAIRLIAREMEMSAPALYHYFADRDTLITALIVDAFAALADALEAARDAAAPAPAARLRAVLLAYRAWALAHPTDFALIYGTPLPGYDAPRESTVPAVVRGFEVLAGLIAEALAGYGPPPTPAYTTVPPTVAAHVAALIAREGYPISPLAFYLTLVAWARIHGIIMLELFEHIQPVVGDSDAMYRSELDHLFLALGWPV
jgi:AcrR family transcriptional regulator